MNTECNGKSYEFQPLNRRRVITDFNGGSITSDSGVLLLRELELKSGIMKQFASCFRDHRDPLRVEHTLEELIKQRVLGICLGYEDLNDHDELRVDPLLAAAVEKLDLTGAERLRERDRGKPLAGKSTLNRLELAPAWADANSRYQKIVVDPEKVDRFFVDVFLQSHGTPPEMIILDLDATDDPLYGDQEFKFYHGYYRDYCYLPLYIFCGDELLCARLRPSGIDAAEGSVEELSRIISRIRERWPEVRIILRADSGFCREKLMAWCEENKVDYVLGLSKNARLKQEIESELSEARIAYEQSGKPSRVFKDFKYQTRKSWSRVRRVVGKAEYLSKGENPRFVVTSFSVEDIDAASLYEQWYCARGEMENRIKEQQLDLFSDRTSCTPLRANQIRLWFSSVAYVVLNALRRMGLVGTEMARARCRTIRLKLLKIGAQVRVSVRRILVSMASGYPYERTFAAVYKNLQRAGT